MYSLKMNGIALVHPNRSSHLLSLLPIGTTEAYQVLSTKLQERMMNQMFYRNGHVSQATAGRGRSERQNAVQKPASQKGGYVEKAWSRTPDGNVMVKTGFHWLHGSLFSDYIRKCRPSKNSRAILSKISLHNLVTPLRLLHGTPPFMESHQWVMKIDNHRRTERPWYPTECSSYIMLPRRDRLSTYTNKPNDKNSYSSDVFGQVNVISFIMPSCYLRMDLLSVKK